MRYVTSSSLKFIFAVFAFVTLGGSQALAQSAGTPTDAAINGNPLTEDSCEVLATTKGEKPGLREVPGMHVLGRTEEDPLVLVSTPDVAISAVVCWRSEARLAPGDYLVPHKTGYPLYIKSDTGDAATDRTIALEKESGSFRVRLLAGPKWTKAEEDEMTDALTMFNKKATDAS